MTTPDVLTRLALASEHIPAPDDEGLTDGPDDDVALRIVAVDGLMLALSKLRDVLEESLVARLADGQELELMTGHHVSKRRIDGTAKWDKDAVGRALQSAIASKVSVDRSTGEINQVWRGIANEVFDWVRGTWTLPNPLTGPQSGIRRLGLDPGEFRSFGADRHVIDVKGL